MAKDIYGGLYAHLDKLDKAIEVHNLSDALLDENTTRQPNSSPNEKLNVSSAGIKNLSQPQKIKELAKELEKELIFLGINEGNTTECRDPQAGPSDAVDSRGILRKRIKSGLIMEYTFSTQKRNILNFNLNNVSLKLTDIPEDKLIKLLIIIRFFNSVYRHKDNSGASEAVLSPEEIEKRKKEKREENKRRLVLSKL